MPLSWIESLDHLEHVMCPYWCLWAGPHQLVKMASLLKRKIPIKFFDFWADHPLFLPLITEAWGKEVTSTPMFILCNKLKHIKKVLRDFSKKYFAKISDRVLVAKRVMEKAQCLMQTNPSDLEIYRAEPILVKENMRLAKAEESFLRQNSWL